MTAKKKIIAYWILTTVVLLPNLAAAFGYISGTMDENLEHLGYPMIFGKILGTWKILAAGAIVAPRFAPWVDRAKDAAYGGYLVVFTSAVISHASVGDGVDKIMPPAFMALLLAISYVLRPRGA